MAFSVVHDLEKNFSLARQADTAFGEGFLQATGAIMGVYSLAGGDSMCCSGHNSVQATGYSNWPGPQVLEPTFFKLHIVAAEAAAHTKTRILKRLLAMRD
jgi:hypothetical protein